MTFTPRNPVAGFNIENARSVVSDPRFQSIMQRAEAGSLTTNQLGNAYVYLTTAYPYFALASPRPTSPTKEDVTDLWKLIVPLLRS